MKHKNQKPIPTDILGRRERIRWLQDHPIWKYSIPGYGSEFGSLNESLCMDFVHVDPFTKHIEENDSRNTEFAVWLESGSWDNDPADGMPDAYCHDIRLDCGATSLEEALLKLASLVECFYNEDGTDKDIWWCGWKHDRTKECVGNPDEFCSDCGFKIRGES